jgi:hypothetical protein
MSGAACIHRLGRAIHATIGLRASGFEIPAAQCVTTLSHAAGLLPHVLTKTMISRVSPHEQEPIENDTMIFSHRLFIGLTLGLLWTMVGVASPLDAEQAERAIIAACSADNGGKICAAACLQHGFKDTFSDLESYSNATNKLCQYELATKQARKMRYKNAANVKVLRCDESPRPVCRGGGWRISFFGQEAGSGVKIRSPGGRTTTLTKCGTCSDNLWEWESGPLKRALVKNYEGGVLLFLNPPVATHTRH